MPSIFEKPLEDITKEDIDDLLGWPEGETTEFKETLAGENGRPDPWMNGGKVADFAKGKVFKEIVALANSAGGHFFLGIKESETKPPRAASITPVPRCADLADCLRRSADDSIDPPIPSLNAFGVVTEDDGSGVVVFRVPQSRSAPHRSSDRHCYVRRGEKSEPISMREIQDLTIHLSRRMDEIKRRFDRAHDDFLKWLYPDGPDGAIGLRVTAVPVGASLYVDRVYPKVGEKVLRLEGQFVATLSPGSQKIPLGVTSYPTRPFPVFRGARKESEDDDGVISFSAYRDGVLELRRRLSEKREGFYLGSILNHVANVVKAARAFAKVAERAGCEYGLTLEIQRKDGPSSLSFEIKDLASHRSLRRMKLGAPLIVEEPLTLGNRDALMNRVLADIYDACQVQVDEPPTIEIDWDD